jgi:protein TonB
MRRKLMPLQAKMDLSMALGDVGGDFSVHFGVSAPALDEQIRDLIFELGELDEPPRPLTRLKPIYPPQARLRRVEGWVELEFVVAADGTVRDVDVIAAQPAELFTRSATRAVQRWRFVPGTKDGQPVAARVRQKVTFQLD